MQKNLLMTKERLDAQMTNVDRIRNLANRFQTNLSYYKDVKNNYNVHSCRIGYIDDIDKETCRSLLKRIDAIVREDDDIEIALDIVDKEVMVDVLGIMADWCEKCQIIWKKMQRRRLGRG